MPTFQPGQSDAILGVEPRPRQHGRHNPIPVLLLLFLLLLLLLCLLCLLHILSMIITIRFLQILLYKVIRTVAAPPSIVVKCGGVVLRVVVCGVVLVMSCLRCCSCCVCDLFLSSRINAHLSARPD